MSKLLPFSTVKSKAFDYIVIFMLLLNLKTVIIESTLDVENISD